VSLLELGVTLTTLYVRPWYTEVWEPQNPHHDFSNTMYWISVCLERI